MARFNGLPVIRARRRPTGIPSLKGAVCATSKDKEYLENIAKTIDIKLKGTETRTDICDMIRTRLLFLEKYGTSKKKNKITYIIIRNSISEKKQNNKAT